MTSSQRSFVQRLNRRTAGELRRDISSSKFTNSSELPRSISGSSINSLSAIPSMELVEPPEFEDLVRQSKPGSEKNSLNLMKEFPLDDLQVELVHRKIRTVVPAIIENEVQDPLVRDVIKQYTSDFTVVNKRYMKSSNQHWELSFLRGGLLRCLPQNEYETDIIDSNAANKLSSEKTMTIASSASDAVRGSWAHSMYDLKNSQADPLLPHLLDRIPMEEVDKNNDIDRQTGRQDALYVLLPQQTEEEMIERRQTAVVPSEHFGHQMLLRIQQLKLDLEIEPIFASIALYDVKEKKKISETFHFDLNPPYIKKLLSNHVPREDQSTLSKSCILSVTYPTSDIFLVIRLEKVLQQGDISEVADPYMRDSRDDKVREKARETAWAYCERLGKYRMPLAWAAVNLQTAIFGQCIGERETEKEHGRADSLDRRISGLAGQFDSFRKKSRDDSYLPGGSTDKRGGQDKRSSWSSDEVAAMMDSFKPVPITLNQFYKQESDRLRDEDLFKFLQDMKRASSSLLKKLKLIPGVLKLEISPCPEILPYCLSPELVPLDPYPDKNGWPVKELVEFPQRDVYKPFTHYRNLLYIYPRNLNFNNRQGTARNIAVKVQFMSSEDVTGAQPAIFGKSSGPEMISEAYSVVTYHCKTPDFYDEIKIKLPPLLHNGHHLLFTFYQVL